MVRTILVPWLIHNQSVPHIKLKYCFKNTIELGITGWLTRWATCSLGIHSSTNHITSYPIVAYYDRPFYIFARCYTAPNLVRLSPYYLSIMTSIIIPLKWKNSFLIEYLDFGIPCINRINCNLCWIWFHSDSIKGNIFTKILTIFISIIRIVTATTFWRPCACYFFKF